MKQHPYVRLIAVSLAALALLPPGRLPGLPRTGAALTQNVGESANVLQTGTVIVLGSASCLPERGADPRPI